jgi:hypothetical protein
MPRHQNQEAMTVNPIREAVVRAAAKKGIKPSFLPGRYGSWYEERLREREEQAGRPVSERDGNWRSVSNGDFSEDEIKDLELKYGASIKRPCPKK